MMLIFDMSGVVFSNGLKTAIEKISKNYNLDPKAVKFVLDGSFSHDYRTGKIKEEEFWEKAKNYWKVDDINGIIRLFFEAYTLQMDTVEFIKRLRGKGIKIAYLSNAPKDRTEYLDKKYNFIKLFDLGLFSFDAQAMKPDKKMFEKLIEKFNIDIKEAIYIDDREKNLIPAKELGMKTIHFKDINQLENELRELGIEV